LFIPIALWAVSLNFRGTAKGLALTGGMSAAAANFDYAALLSLLTILAAIFTVGFWSTITSRMSTFTRFFSH
jgi:hypothetical protein